MSGMRGDLLGMIACEKVGRPDATPVAWKSLSLDRDGIDAFVVTLADVVPYVRGPKKGQPNYRACTAEQAVYVLPAERTAWLEANPDICPRCANTREIFVSWSVDDGTKTRRCDACADWPDAPDVETAPTGSLFDADAPPAALPSDPEGVKG